MQFGARLAAQRLLKAGAPAVLWMAPSFATEQLTGSLLLGVVAPLLETLHRRMASASAEVVKKELLSVGGPIFGDGWQAGCLVASSPSSPSSLPALGVWEPTRRVGPGGKWLHDVRASKPAVKAKAADSRAAAKLHESIKFTAYTTDGNKRCDLLSLGADVLRRWISEAISTKGDQLIAAMYADEERDEPALQVRIAIGNVAFLHELRDLVLRGILEER